MNAYQILELLIGEKRFYDGAWHVFDAQGNELTAPSGVLFRAIPGALLWNRFADEEQDFKGTTYSPGAAKRGKSRRRKLAERHDAYPFAPAQRPAGDALEGDSRDFWLRAFGVDLDPVEAPAATEPPPQGDAPQAFTGGETARGEDVAAQADGFEINGDTFAQARDALDRIRAQAALSGQMAPAQEGTTEDEDEAAILALLACYMD